MAELDECHTEARGDHHSPGEREAEPRARPGHAAILAERTGCCFRDPFDVCRVER